MAEPTTVQVATALIGGLGKKLDELGVTVEKTSTAFRTLGLRVTQTTSDAPNKASSTANTGTPGAGGKQPQEVNTALSAELEAQLLDAKGLHLQAEIKRIEQQVRGYRVQKVDPKTIDTWERMRRDEAPKKYKDENEDQPWYMDLRDAASGKLKGLSDEYMDIAKGLEPIVSKVFGNMETAIVNFAKTGKFEFKDMIDSMLQDLLTFAVRRAILAPLFGAVGGWLDSLSGGGNSPTPFRRSEIAQIEHSGGIIGFTTPDAILAMPASLFSGAPRFHSGLMPDEFPAILQKGEIVLPKDFPVNRTEGGPAESVVNVNVINNSNSKVGVREQKKAEGGRDIQVMIGEAVAGDLSAGGPVYRAMRKQFGLSPTLAGR